MQNFDAATKILVPESHGQVRDLSVETTSKLKRKFRGVSAPCCSVLRLLGGGQLEDPRSCWSRYRALPCASLALGAPEHIRRNDSPLQR